MLTELISALQNGETEQAKLLAQGVDVNAVDEDGWNAVMFAAQEGNTEVLGILIERNADVNAVDENGWNAVMLAADNGHEEAVKLLLSKNAKLHDVNSNGDDALMIATKKGHRRIIKLLWGQNPDVNLDDNSIAFQVNNYIYRKDNERSMLPQMDVELIFWHMFYHEKMQTAYELRILLKRDDLKFITESQEWRDDQNLTFAKAWLEGQEFVRNTSNFYQEAIQPLITFLGKTSVLIKVVENNFIDLFKALLKEPNVNVNIRNNEGETLLYIGFADTFAPFLYPMMSDGFLFLQMKHIVLVQHFHTLMVNFVRWSSPSNWVGYFDNR